jgi:hypothetical protein
MKFIEIMLKASDINMSKNGSPVIDYTGDIVQKSSCDCGSGKNEKDTPRSECGCGSKIESGAIDIPICSCADGSPKKILIDFLYLDLSVCSRCRSTESTLAESLEQIQTLLKSAGYEVVLNKVHIDSVETAKNYRFVSSPTIRVNGSDIVSNHLESNCVECGDYCGGEVDCRDWMYDGKRYTEPPKQLIIDGILKAIFIPQKTILDQNDVAVPENIIQFFESRKFKNTKI